MFVCVLVAAVLAQVELDPTRVPVSSGFYVQAGELGGDHLIVFATDVRSAVSAYAIYAVRLSPDGGVGPPVLVARFPLGRYPLAISIAGGVDPAGALVSGIYFGEPAAWGARVAPGPRAVDPAPRDLVLDPDSTRTVAFDLNVVGAGSQYVAQWANARTGRLELGRISAGLGPLDDGGIPLAGGALTTVGLDFDGTQMVVADLQAPGVVVQTFSPAGQLSAAETVAPVNLANDVALAFERPAAPGHLDRRRRLVSRARLRELGEGCPGRPLAVCARPDSAAGWRWAADGVLHRRGGGRRGPVLLGLVGL